MAIADDFRTMPDFKPTAGEIPPSAPLRHEVNEGLKRVMAKYALTSAAFDLIHAEMDQIFPGTNCGT